MEASAMALPLCPQGKGLKMAENTSQMEQLKAQLQIERNIADDDTINAMPDSGNVDHFAKRLVSAAEPTNLANKARDRFGSEASKGAELPDNIVDGDDEWGNNDNNRRVAERMRKDAEIAANNRNEVSTRQRKARDAALAKGNDEVVGQQRELDREANPNNAAVDLGEVHGVEENGGATEATQDGDVVLGDAEPMRGQRTARPKPNPAWKPQG